MQAPEFPPSPRWHHDCKCPGMRNRTCHCGHRRGDPNIQEEPEFTTWGWIMLSMFGMTPRPHHIAFRCQLCRMEVGRSRDPKLLERRSARAAA